MSKVLLFPAPARQADEQTISTLTTAMQRMAADHQAQVNHLERTQRYELIWACRFTFGAGVIAAAVAFTALPLFAAFLGALTK